MVKTRKTFTEHLASLNHAIPRIIEHEKEVDMEVGIERPIGYYELKSRMYRSELPRWIGEVLNDAAAQLFAEGDTRKVASLLNKAIKYAPDLFEAYNNLGVVLAEQGDYSKAIKMIDRSLIINAANSAAVFNKSRIEAHHAGAPRLSERQLGVGLQVSVDAMP